MDASDLWAQIEAAGPLGPDALLPDPPPGVDLDAWTERALTQADRRRSFIACYAWGVPSREAIERIRDFVSGRRLLEVCAGNGLWAALLRAAGVEIVATDAAPVEGAGYVKVEALEAEAAIRAHRECGALLLCWPPFRDDCAARALEAFGGDCLVYIGDARFTGDERLHGLLHDHWALDARMPIPTWPGIADGVCFYSRHTRYTRT